MPGEWKWLDASVMDYANWGKDQPLDHIHVEISTSDGMWLTAEMQSYRPYICKKEKGNFKSQAAAMMKKCEKLA